LPDLRTTLDAYNPLFERLLAERETAGVKDFVKENRVRLAAVYLARTDRARQDRYPSVPRPRSQSPPGDGEQVYMYSTQALNTVELQRRAMVARLSKVGPPPVLVRRGA
jgi:hypothetical protein